MSDTKGTKELIRALNPESELRAYIQREKQFVQTSELVKDERKKGAFQRGITYLNRKRKNAYKAAKDYILDDYGETSVSPPNSKLGPYNRGITYLNNKRKNAWNYTTRKSRNAWNYTTRKSKNAYTRTKDYMSGKSKTNKNRNRNRNFFKGIGEL